MRKGGDGIIWDMEMVDGWEGEEEWERGIGGEGWMTRERGVR